METTIENQNLQTQSERPQFLSVLCVLTWVCCGFMFISAAISMISQPSVEKQEEQLEQVRAYSPEAAERMEELFESQNSPAFIASNAISLITLGISAFGAAMMWQLKRKGFYVYIVGELLQYTSTFLMGSAPFAVTATMFKMDASVIMSIMLAAMLVFDIIFFAMYATNLKHMKNK